MAPTRGAPYGDGAVVPRKVSIDTRTIPKGNRAHPVRQPKSHRLPTKSHLALPKPLTNRARRIITEKTLDLVQRRAALANSLRHAEDSFAQGHLPREELLDESEKLARRELRHIRAIDNLLQERKRLRRLDPSDERAADHELLSKMQSKLIAHLEAYLSDSDDGSSQSDAEDPVKSLDASKPNSHQNLPTSKSFAHNSKSEDQSMSEDASSAGNREAQPGFDGAFDDHVRENPRKRKFEEDPAALAAEKERRKKAKKEKKEARKANQQAAALPVESQSGTTSAAHLPFKGEDSEQLAGCGAIVDSRNQPNRPGDEDINQVPVARINKDTNVTETQAAGAKTKRDAKHNFLTDGGLATTQPWYMFHARAMMEPTFNDHVLPSRKKFKNQTRDYFVSGALLNSDHVLMSALPTPPASSSPSPSSEPTDGNKESRERSSFKHKRVNSGTSQGRRSDLRRRKSRRNVSHKSGLSYSNGS